MRGENDAPEIIVYYTENQVSDLQKRFYEQREADRRRYRRGIIMLYAYVVAIVLPVRIAFDVLVRQPSFAFLQPYGAFIIACFAILLLALGIRNVFARRY